MVSIFFTHADGSTFIIQYEILFPIPGMITDFPPRVPFNALSATLDVPTRQNLANIPCWIILLEVSELVSIGPGWTDEKEIPESRYSSLRPRVNEYKNALEAGYTCLYPMGEKAAMLEMFIT